MQPPRTKKLLHLLGQKISHLLKEKKKSRNLQGQKNHATSHDIKNHATYQNKKIIPPSRNLTGQKNQEIWQDKKNHATSGDKKNHATSRDKTIKPPLSIFCQDILSLSHFTLVQYYWGMQARIGSLVKNESFFKINKEYKSFLIVLSLYIMVQNHRLYSNIAVSPVKKKFF